MVPTTLSGVASARKRSSSEYGSIRSNTYDVKCVINDTCTNKLYISLPGTISVLKSGKILIPQIDVLPTAVVANGDKPPELEIRFDMPHGPDFMDMKAELPANWQLRFIHNQLFKHFYNPSRFCPGAFHSTIVRKAEFRSEMVSICMRITNLPFPCILD